MARAIFAAVALFLLSAPMAEACENISGKQVRVVMLRGWLDGGSLGMNDLADRLNKIHGVTASAHSHNEWRGLIQEAERFQGSVVLAGHSRGALFAIEMARRMEKPIAAIVSFDAAPIAWASKVPPNVRRLIDISVNDRWLTVADKKKTTVVRVNTDVGHVRVDDDEDNQNLAIAEVCRLLK